MDAMKNKGRSDAIDLPPEVISALTAESPVRIANDWDGCMVYVDEVLVHTQREPVSSEAVAAHVAKLREHAKRAAYTTGLRDLADFLDEHPEVPLGNTKWHSTLGPHFYSYGENQITSEELLVAVEAMDAQIETPVHQEKDLRAVKHFGPIKYAVQAPRALVCEERPVTVTEFVLPESLAAREQKAA